MYLFTGTHIYNVLIILCSSQSSDDIPQQYCTGGVCHKQNTFAQLLALPSPVIQSTINRQNHRHHAGIFNIPIASCVKFLRI
jgi:hypothetical protein